MPWIDLVGEEDAEGIVARAYETARRYYGRVPEILRALSPRPKALQKHTPLFLEIMFGEGALPRLERELIAVVVSTVNGCRYCMTTHGYGMVAEGADPQLVAALHNSPEDAAVEPARRTLADYVIKLTKVPSSVGQADVDALRAAGWNDAQIHDAILVTAFFNYVNRFVEATGIELEPDRQAAPVEDRGIYG